MKRILLLEDDSMLSNGIVSAFAGDDYEFTQCMRLRAALDVVKKESFDLFLLDINLPDGDGVEFCKLLRENNVNAPIAVMTVKDMETDIVYGLEAGADDYITKPFTLMVLRAHVHALLRRENRLKNEKTNVYRYAAYLFDFQNMVFSSDGLKIELSKTEQRLLQILVANKGNIVKRQRLIEQLWDMEGNYVDENALSVVIKRLRDKLEKDAASPVYIKTAYGLGYKWEESGKEDI